MSYLTLCSLPYFKDILCIFHGISKWSLTLKELDSTRINAKDTVNLIINRCESEYICRKFTNTLFYLAFSITVYVDILSLFLNRKK